MLTTLKTLIARHLPWWLVIALGAAVKIASALLGAGDERLLLGVGGLTDAVVGVLALSWPGVTVLVLTVFFGVRTVMLGFGQIATGLQAARRAGR
jgi:uncharacterized membrane protein HdeD (DUF308 family)